MSILIWKQCLKRLQIELSPTEFSIWIRPLKAEFKKNILNLYAPNKFALDWIKDKYINNFNKLLHNFGGNNIPLLILKINKNYLNNTPINNSYYKKTTSHDLFNKNYLIKPEKGLYNSNINYNYKFYNFIKGKCNKIAYQAAHLISKNLENYYNPLFIYGKTGLGKTHLLHAIANNIIKNKNHLKTIYINSECFIQNMITALKNKTIETFKTYYRSANILLIDDIQFFANKKHSQEELFHTINSLVDSKQQIVLTSDQHPKKIKGINKRLKSRFESGLTTSIDAPDLKTRTTILIQKSCNYNIILPNNIALFIASQLKSNVRELEGMLNKIIASARFTKQTITIDFAYKILKNSINFKNKIISINEIQKRVSKYYQITIPELLSSCRFKSIVQPRQLAMAISKKLTNYSLSEIGLAFNKRDHTTVLYACKKINQLRKINQKVNSDFLNLLNTFTL